MNQSSEGGHPKLDAEVILQNLTKKNPKIKDSWWIK